MTKIIAIKNQKGGVAKTTTCLSLGAALAEMGYTVLLIDLDPQAHLTLSLGLKPDVLHRTVGDALLANSSLVSVSRETRVFDLDIVPASQELALIDKLLYQQQQYEFNLKRRFEAMQHSYYEYVLIDCPPAFNTLTLNALTAADLLIVPVQAEYYATVSLKRMIGLVKLVQAKTNPDLSYKLLITMYDRRNKICTVIKDRMEQKMSPWMYQTVIEIDTKLRECPAFGQPITTYAPQTRGAQQYRALAREITRQ